MPSFRTAESSSAVDEPSRLQSGTVKGARWYGVCQEDYEIVRDKTGEQPRTRNPKAKRLNEPPKLKPGKQPLRGCLPPKDLLPKNLLPKTRYKTLAAKKLVSKKPAAKKLAAKSPCKK